MKTTAFTIVLILMMTIISAAQASTKSDFDFSYIESQRTPVTAGKSFSIWSDSGTVRIRDVSLITLMYLEHYEKTRDSGSLKKGHEGLEFLCTVADDRGLFPHTFPLQENDAAKASAPSISGGYAFWALARGCRIMLRQDAPFARTLDSCLEKTIATLRKESAAPGDSLHGQNIPAGLLNGQSDVTALYVMGLLECQEASQNNGDLITLFCNAMSTFGGTNFEEFPFGAHYQQAEPLTAWRLKDNRIVSALALAGKKFTENSWIDSAEREANGLYTHFLASCGPLCAMAPGPVIYPQEPGGAETMTSNLMNLFRATDKEAYSAMAGLSAGWFSGNNEKGEVMFDRASGRASLSLEAKGKSPQGSAGASAEAYLTLMAVMQSPAEEYLTCRSRGLSHSFQILEAEDGKAVRKDYEIEDIIYPGGTSGQYVEITRENSFWIKFDVALENEYDFYLVYLKQTGFDMGTSIMMRIDGDKIFSVPLGGSPDKPYMCMKEVVEPRPLLPGPHSLGIRFSGLLHSRSTILDAVILQPAIEWKVYTRPDGTVAALVKSFLNHDREFDTARLGLKNLHVTSISTFSKNGTGIKSASGPVRVPAYGYAIIRGK